MNDDVNYLAAIRTEGDRLGRFAGSDPSIRVPTCPEFDLAGLLEHIGWVWAFVTAQLRAEDPLSPASPGAEGAPGDDESPGEWLRTRLGELLAALDEAGTDTPMWTFGSDQTSDFYHRRMAHESALHRWDADNAINAASAVPIDRVLALDGIDEIADFGMTRSLQREGSVAPTGSLHLHATDGDGEWTFELIDGSVAMSHGHSKGDAAVRGAVSDLLLFIWGRGRARCELFGDETVADQWAALAP
ncbi:MAG: maleylpyruvate isomerase family mycothiol-dependent enzyme [Acidobacteria bacterium]|nr:maleylpyruvate isomerase family mycothiol-dependent enzyme [Acidobacteriota bacterium]